VPAEYSGVDPYHNDEYHHSRENENQNREREGSDGSFLKPTGMIPYPTQNRVRWFFSGGEEVCAVGSSLLMGDPWGWDVWSGTK
jgi:hypothetical protein